MGILALGRATQREHGLRPLDVLRDLHGVGDLMQVAFADDIAQEGSQFLGDLAFMMLASPFLWVFRRISADLRDSFDGFVWLEDGRIVGNVTLTRDDPARRVWTVSNVAVHPDYRRRGIARALMQAVLQRVAERGGGDVVLEVKPGNKPAYELYRRLGFHMVDGVVTARHSGPLVPLPVQPSGVRRLGPHEWPRVYDLLCQTRSPEADRIKPLRAGDYRPTLARRTVNSLSDVWYGEKRYWLAVEGGDRLLAAAFLHLYTVGGSKATLTIHPQARGHVEETIVPAVVADCSAGGQSITVQVSSFDEDAQRILWRYGFKETRHLHRLVSRVP